MMYNNKLVATIKVGNKVLREQGDTVYIPFGSEYSIHFRNLNSTDVAIDVEIDGEDVLDGSSLIVRAGNGGDIEGFMRGNDVSHKFKFIEKTEQISDYRGDRVSDGIIRISFRFEKPKMFDISGYPTGSLTRRITSGSPTFSASNYNTLKSVSYSGEDGITTKGSESNQSFNTTTIGPLERTEHVMVFNLKGETENGIIKKPVLVKTKIQCDVCGTMSKSNNKFCGNCGTSLVI